MRGLGGYDNVSFFPVDGTVPVYDAATCGRVILVFSVCGLPAAVGFGPDVSVGTEFAFMRVYHDSVDIYDRRLDRICFKLGVQYSVVPLFL